MRVVESVLDLRAILDNYNTNKVIGFVPTMGALHNGHCSLIRAAKQKCDVVVTSIFVNPTQFNDKTDLEKYPRTLNEDLAKLEKEGCDVVFVPSVEEIYPDNSSLSLDLEGLDKVMEGEFRPGHFDGVVEVVNRLFNIVKPNFAFFGEKDFQQLSIIRFMVKKLNHDIQIIGCPILREEDGLAMSSRNTLLTEEHRSVSPVIFKALTNAKNNIGKFAVEDIKKELVAQIEDNGLLKVEYVDIVNSATLKSLSNWIDEPMNICVAVFAGKVRLIDNLKLNY